MFEMLQTRTRAEAVADHLREEICAGRLVGGTRLRQNHVAQQLGVSTTPVREAFAMLSQEGLLSSDPHRGVTVTIAGPRDFVENLELRLALEPLAAELAATRTTAADVADLDRLLQQLRGQRPDDVLAVMAADTRLHLRIAAVAQRPQLHELITQLREQASGLLRRATCDVRPPDGTDVQHEAILEALRRGAPRRAAKAMRDHLRFELDAVMVAVEHDRRLAG